METKAAAQTTPKRASSVSSNKPNVARRGSGTKATPASSSQNNNNTITKPSTSSTGHSKLRRLPQQQQQHPSVDKNLTADDAAVGTDAFHNRISEITSFRVVARVRPFIDEELAAMEDQERRSVVEMAGNTTVLLDPARDWAPKAQYEFDASLWSIPPSHHLVHTFADTQRHAFASQRDVYALLAQDLVPHTFSGFNSCILAYGQTGSGKTYTMMGKYDAKAECGGDGEEGIIPRVSCDLFALLQERRAAQERDPDLAPADRATFRVEVSFVEIYMEKVRDLLDPALRHTQGSEKLRDARIREDPQSGPFVDGVTRYQVDDWTQCCRLLERGSQHRTTCATAVHNQSSRSHAIYTLTLVQEYTVPPKDRYSLPSLRTLSGRINLVDLAGSERGGFQEYVKESSAINTSLLALRRVIDSLTERQNMLIEHARADIAGTAYRSEKPLPQVPFRDSVLTWLLSDSFAGNARTTMVATLSPLVKNYGDTLATLQWSSKARNLVTLVRVNDQETVRGGLEARAGQLGAAAASQQQNLDSLRETLRYKQVTAERLARETKLMRVAVEETRKKREAAVRGRAAVTIQRAYRRRLHAKALAACEAEKRAVIDSLARRDTDLAAVEARRRAAEAELAEARKRQARAAQEAEAARKRAAAIEAERRPALQDRAAAAGERKAALCAEMDADGIRERHRQATEKEAAAARAAVAAEREAVAAREAVIKEREATIQRGETEEWRTKIASDKESLEELRRELAELRARRDEVIALRDATRERHAKVCKKK